jgi:hypothetical protein
MLINRTVTKKILETIVHETFSNFGHLSSSSLLDSLKLLGFYYATNAGISINIEDLKTPDVKRKFIATAEEETIAISTQWQEGFISDIERFQTIIDSWNIATDSLKNRIIDYYENFDPANNLYIMAFSGARGNMSQVRQLVGMRGLMSDQDGNIIDLPIQANFREGLSSIDYIISSYGARKGIVDTALKTADSGYLTRRLIYVAQDLVIRQLNCETKKGVIVLLNKKTTIKNLIGRVLISANSAIFPYPELEPISFLPLEKKKETKDKKIFVENTDLFLTEKILKELKEFEPLSLNLKSPLTCNSNNSICQSCYGWDLAQKKRISLGDAVGIIAAQSIGEPGTQLTMRTFHTGGIFTSENLKQIEAPFSGRLSIPESLKTIPYRTNHGVIVAKLQQEVMITLMNWTGLKKEIFLEIGSFLYLTTSGFVKQNQLISEYSTQSLVPTGRRLKPIYAKIAGEIKFENFSILKSSRERRQDKRTIQITKDDGIVWLAYGKLFSLPKEAEYKFPKELNKQKAFASLKIVTPFGGFLELNHEKIIITKEIFNEESNEIEEEKIDFVFSGILKEFSNCTLTFSLFVKNYQYVDESTVLGIINIFPKYEGKVYLARKKKSRYLTTLFLVTESDVWKVNSEQVNNFSFFQKKKTLVRAGTEINQNSAFAKSGFFLEKEGFKMVFQKTVPIFLSAGTIINYNKGDFILEKQLFATLVNFTQQTEDIVQGLPKIEELIEARRPKIKACLCTRPGILLNSSCNLLETKVENEFIKCKLEKSTALKKLGLKKGKFFFQILHSIFLKTEIFLFNNKIVKITPIPPIFYPIKKKKKKKYEYNQYYTFKNNSGEKFLLNNKANHSNWLFLNNNLEKDQSSKIDYTIYNYKKNNPIIWEKLNNQILFQNKKLSSFFIVKTLTNQYLLLETINPIERYTVSLTSQILFGPGKFIDIGEPITEGTIDIHELLAVLVLYHQTFDGTFIGTLRSLNKFQLILVHSIQAIYQSQGVSIASKHVEIIVRQMTSKVIIKESGDTPLLPGEFFRLSFIMEIYKALMETKNTKVFKPPVYEPFLLSTTNSSLNKEGFLSSAGFQETKRILTKASLEGVTDWLRGLKECVIIGRLIPAGSTFLNYKNYLDDIYLFKD